MYSTHFRAFSNIEQIPDSVLGTLIRTIAVRYGKFGYLAVAGDLAGCGTTQHSREHSRFLQLV